MLGSLGEAQLELCKSEGIRRETVYRQYGNQFSDQQKTIDVEYRGGDGGLEEVRLPDPL